MTLTTKSLFIAAVLLVGCATETQEREVVFQLERTNAPDERWQLPAIALAAGLGDQIRTSVAIPIDDSVALLRGQPIELQTMNAVVFTLVARDGLITGDVAGVDSTISVEYTLDPIRMVITDPLETVTISIHGVRDPVVAEQIVARLAILAFAKVADAEHGANQVSRTFKDQDCPATSPGTTNTKDDWCLDNWATHGDADACYRGYGPKAGNQCCYDKEGKLITEGAGAGTADTCGPAEGENKDGTCNWSVCRVIGHFIVDVIPSLWPF